MIDDERSAAKKEAGFGRMVGEGKRLLRRGQSFRVKRLAGEMAEWFNAHAWKA